MLPIKLKLDESFFEEEVRCGFHVTRERKEIWAIELDLLAEFDRVCRKHNLRYFIDGGTLLGALRHKGFIPWDDDVDVVMLREEYDKLLQIAPKEFQQPYFFQCAYTDQGYLRGHSQLRNSQTCGALKEEAYTVSFNQGMFLDIFVLDGVPEDSKKLEQQMAELRHRKDMMGRVFRIKMCGNPPKYLLKMARKQLFLKTGMIRKKYQKYESCAKQYEGSEDVYLLTFYRQPEEIKRFKREWYEKTEYLPFEMLQCPVPAGHQGILEGYYGKDYMTPLQVPNAHGNLIIDTQRSYREVLKK